MLLSALIAALFACQAAIAEDQPGAEEKPKVANREKAREEKKTGQPQTKPALRGEYAIMGKTLKLDEETRAKLQAQVEANKKAMTDLEAAQKVELAELREAIVAAKKARDKEKLTELQTKRQALDAAKAKLKAEGTAKIMALLTEEQRAAWNAFTVRRAVMTRFKKMKLSEEQLSQIEKLCAAAAKTMPAAAGDQDKEAKKARTEAYDKLYGEIYQQVLTDEQRARAKKWAEMPKGRGKAKEAGKAKPKGPAKDKGAKEGEGGDAEAKPVKGTGQ